jgi:hypothetical protein
MYRWVRTHADDSPEFIGSTSPRSAQQEAQPMSHHFDTPTAQEDPRLNLCDFYLFGSAAGRTAFAMTVNPAADVETVAPFRDEAIYVFRFDTDGDRREDVAFKVHAAEVVHVSTAAGEAHAQRVEVRYATGAEATSGADGQVIASGTTGSTILGDDGVRVFAGVAQDVFGGDAAAVAEFQAAYTRGSYQPEAFDSHVNFFAGRTVGVIVLEVPDAMLGTSGLLHAWPTISLVGHAPEQQVARWGLPLFTHLFLDDDELREAFNRSAPSADDSAFVASTQATVARYVALAGTSSDPQAYARRVVNMFGSMTLPFVVGSTASFDYTGFNGRALADNVMDNMLSLLTNSPLGTGVKPDRSQISDDFPFFTLPMRTQ